MVHVLNVLPGIVSGLSSKQKDGSWMDHSADNLARPLGSQPGNIFLTHNLTAWASK